MKTIFHVLRQSDKDSAPYWEDFDYETEGEADTVATALMRLPVQWDCSCLQKKCGACAMVINGVPALACDTMLARLKGTMVTLEPLRKFPTVADLRVDRSSMEERLRQFRIYREGTADHGADATVLEAGGCMQCGLCLEVCPNYYPGAEFGGMAAMNPAVRVMNGTEGKHLKSLRRSYVKTVYDGCGKSLACRDICPAGVNIEKLMTEANHDLRKSRAI